MIPKFYRSEFILSNFWCEQDFNYQNFTMAFVGQNSIPENSISHQQSPPSAESNGCILEKHPLSNTYIFGGRSATLVLTKTSRALYAFWPSAPPKTPLTRPGRLTFTRKLNSAVGNVIDTPSNQPPRRLFCLSWRGDHGLAKIKDLSNLQRCEKERASRQLNNIFGVDRKKIKSDSLQFDAAVSFGY